MTALFSRWLPCVTLASWSAILLHFAQAPKNAFFQAISSHTFLFSGRVNDFLIPTFRPYVIIAGLVLAVMALAFIFFPADAECCSASECGHPLSRFGGGKWLTFLVLLVPVGAAAVMTPDSFSKNVIQNRGVVTDASALGLTAKTGAYAPPEFPLPTADRNFDDNSVETPNGPMTPENAPNAPATAAATTPASPAAPAEPNDYVKRTPEGYLMAEVLDMLYGVQDATVRKVFEGKTVTLTAQLMPADTTNPSAVRFKAVRMFMTCCAADARPVATVVEAATMPDLPEMTWFTVVGKATFPIEGGKRVAIIKADSVTKADPPEESMLY